MPSKTTSISHQGWFQWCLSLFIKPNQENQVLKYKVIKQNTKQEQNALKTKFVKQNPQIEQNIQRSNQSLNSSNKNANQEKQHQVQNIRQMINTFQKQLQKIKEQSKKMSSPEHFKKNKELLQSKFIQKIQTIQVSQNKDKSSFEKQKLIIGSISVGKSALLNFFLSNQFDYSKQKEGVGQTTLEMKKVLQNQKMEIYDSPGINVDFSVFKYEVLQKLIQMDQFYVCYCDSLKNVNITLRVLAAIRKRKGQKIFLVRTKCDAFTDQDQSTLQQQLHVDRQYLENLKKQNQIDQVYQIYAISTKKSMSFEDNERFCRQLLEQ